MQKRTLLRSTTTGALLALAVGAIPAATQAAHSQATVTLNMWAWADRNLCAQDFQASHPGVKVVYTTQNNPIPKLNVLKRAGGSGMPDVVFDNVEYAANYYQLGLTTDLSSLVPSAVRAKYAPGSLSGLMLGGKLVGVPHDMAAEGIWWNVPNMKAAGLSVPTSYAQVYADAAKLAKTKKYVISWQGTDAFALTDLAWGNHAKWFTLNSNGSWTVNIDSPLTEQLATQYVNAIRSGGVLPDDPFGPVSGKAYAQGKVAFAVGPNWLGPYGIEPGYPKQKGVWTFTASLPSVGWWGGGAFYVPPQSQHVALAQQLAVYCSTSPTFQHQARTVPSFTGVYNVAGAFQVDSYYANANEVPKQFALSAQRTGTGWTYKPQPSVRGYPGGGCAQQHGQRRGCPLYLAKAAEPGRREPEAAGRERPVAACIPPASSTREVLLAGRASIRVGGSAGSMSARSGAEIGDTPPRWSILIRRNPPP